MKRMLAVLVLLLISGAATAQVQFPKGPITVPPPGAAIIVTAKQICVIEDTKEFFLKASPGARVTIKPETGPLAYKGEFPDKPGVSERRTFKGPFLFEVSGLGDVELFYIPKGVTDEKDIQSKLYTFVGEAPPDPDVTPKPPGPKPPPSGERLYWMVIVEETADRAGNGIYNDTAYWNTWKTAGHNWMSYDATTVKGKRYADKAKILGASLPACLLIDLKAASPAEPVAAFTLKDKADTDAQLAKNGAKK